MNLQEKIDYILNFDENKLFNTEIDDKYTNKVAYRKEIQKAKEKFKEYFKRKPKTDTVRAFDFCNMYLTDTPHQALAEYIIKGLKPKYIEFVWFIDYLTSELQEIDNNGS